jgi:hypothetical protein
MVLLVPPASLVLPTFPHRTAKFRTAIAELAP